MAKQAWQVHKFGGTSLAEADCFRRVGEILLAEKHERQAVVVSAMGGMTDALLDMVAAAELSAAGIQSDLAAIAQRYEACVRALIESPGAVEELMSQFNSELADASDVLQAVFLVRSAADRSRDLVAGFGELWSARLLCIYLN